MGISEFHTLLLSTGYPVAYDHFPKSEPHNPPFLCYISTGADNVPADGKVFYSSPKMRVELYTVKKDQEAEGKVETALSSFFWTKDEGTIEDENMYMVTYDLNL